MELFESKWKEYLNEKKNLKKLSGMSRAQQFRYLQSLYDEPLRDPNDVQNPKNYRKTSNSTFKSPVMANIVDSKAYKNAQQLHQFGEITSEELDTILKKLLDFVEDGNFDSKKAEKYVDSLGKAIEFDEKPVSYDFD